MPGDPGASGVSVGAGCCFLLCFGKQLCRKEVSHLCFGMVSHQILVFSPNFAFPGWKGVVERGLEEGKSGLVVEDVTCECSRHSAL